MAFNMKQYGLFQYGLLSATAARRIDVVNDTLKVALTTSTHVPNHDTDAYFSDLTNEISGTGYTAGGVTVTSVTLNYVTGTNLVVVDAVDPEWTTATFTARNCHLYKDTGVAATSPLIAYGTFAADRTVTAGTFTLQLDATNGLFTTDVKEA